MSTLSKSFLSYTLGAILLLSAQAAHSLPVLNVHISKQRLASYIAGLVGIKYYFCDPLSDEELAHQRPLSEEQNWLAYLFQAGNRALGQKSKEPKLKGIHPTTFAAIYEKYHATGLIAVVEKTKPLLMALGAAYALYSTQEALIKSLAFYSPDLAQRLANKLGMATEAECPRPVPIIVT